MLPSLTDNLIFHAGIRKWASNEKEKSRGVWTDKKLLIDFFIHVLG
jgi:hypothetical protein